LDRKRPVLRAQCLLALARTEKGAIPPRERGRAHASAIFRSDANAIGSGYRMDCVGFHELRPEWQLCSCVSWSETACRELPGRESALGRKGFRERFVPCVKALGW